MKFNTKEDRSEFKPFTITVETQEEAVYLASLVGGAGSKIDALFGVKDKAFEIYESLVYFSGANMEDFPDLLIVEYHYSD